MKMKAWTPVPPRQVRAFTVIKNLATAEFEFHLRGVKLAAVSVFKAKDSRDIDNIVDNLHGRFFREIKFLEEHPEATLAPAHEADPAVMVPTLADL